ncbi:MAG TPA: hypothetical protein VMU29_13295 [Smithella sp.]|nr:hypothetical protein [Smithella sp.]
MNIKGIFFATTKPVIIQAFGEERWNAFIAKLAQKDPYFSKVIMAISYVPIEKLVIFFDEMCKEFFNGDKMAYEIFGKSGAKYVLQPGGMFNAYLLNKDLKNFVEFVLPKLWSTYYDGGTITTSLENNIVHIKITGVDFKYVYFEQLLQGYFQQALKVVGKKTIPKKVRSITQGDNDIYFQYAIQNP